MSKNKLFDKIQIKNLGTNWFDLTHDVKLSCKMGDLIPVMCTLTNPGDKFKISAQSLIRFSPLVSPVMHRFDVTIHYFYVPFRILWQNWQKYYTGTATPVFPYISINSGNVDSNPLLNYLGLPKGNASPTTSHNISAMPCAAYQAIWRDYYRDQNLATDPFPNVDTDGYLVDGNNTSVSALFPLRKRAWEHDYLTSALPTAQQGAPVTVPLGTVADKAVLRDTSAGNTTWNTTAGPSPVSVPQVQTSDPAIPADALYVPGQGVSPTNISDLRRAFKLQEFLEKAIRGGQRYVEFVKAMFGVDVGDDRLTRAEYIGGVKSPVVISEVLNTSDTATRAQGSMAGHGVAVAQGKASEYYCREVGYVMGVMSILPKTAYQNGIPRHWHKITDRYDFYFDEFAHIGEQPVYNKEVYAFVANGDNTFGYVPRYAEYKFENNRVAGDFATTLNYWHEGRIFSSLPALNASFVEADPSTRIFAVGTGDTMWCHVLNDVKVNRKMAYYGNPRL